MTIHHLIISCVAIGVAASATVADRIELRRSIRRSVDAPIRLADVAFLEGDHARRFADLVVLPVATDSSPRVERVHVSEIRDLLESAGADWGRIDLGGGELTVRPATARSAGRSLQTTGSGRIATSSSADASAPTTPASFRPLAEAMGGPEDSMRRSIAERIARHWAIAGSDLDTVLFDADLAPLDRLPDDVTRFRISVIGGSFADLVHLKVEGVDSAGRRPAVLIPVRIRILSDVPIAIASIGAGRPVLGLDLDVAVERRPVRPSVLEVPGNLVDVRSIANRRARREIHPGDVLTRDLLVPEIVVERGDEVVVESRVGGYLITYKAVATTDGLSDGRVTCRAVDGDRTATFPAEVVGPGRVRLSSRSR